jgi:hypothetical protein
MIGYSISLFNTAHSILARSTSGGGYSNEYSLQFDGVDDTRKRLNNF